MRGAAAEARLVAILSQRLPHRRRAVGGRAQRGDGPSCRPAGERAGRGGPLAQLGRQVFQGPVLAWTQKMAPTVRRRSLGGRPGPRCGTSGSPCGSHTRKLAHSTSVKGRPGLAARACWARAKDFLRVLVATGKYT